MISHLMYCPIYRTIIQDQTRNTVQMSPEQCVSIINDDINKQFIFLLNMPQVGIHGTPIPNLTVNANIAILPHDCDLIARAFSLIYGKQSGLGDSNITVPATRRC